MKAHFYQRLPHWFDFQDVYKEAVELAPEGGHLVEVGVYEGASLAFLAVEAFNSGKNLKITGIDRFDFPDPGVLGRVQGWIDDEGLGHMVRLHRSESQDGALIFPDASLDFVFIDAYHVYHALMADCAAYFPKLKPTGYLAGHDWSPDYPGVEKACLDFFPTVGCTAVHCSANSWKMVR